MFCPSLHFMPCMLGPVVGSPQLRKLINPHPPYLGLETNMKCVHLRVHSSTRVMQLISNVNVRHFCESGAIAR